MLILDPHGKQVHWFLALPAGRQCGQASMDRLQDVFSSLPPAESRQVKTIAYVLENGAGAFQQAVTEITPAALANLEACQSVWPEGSQNTLQLVKAGMQRWPDRSHLLLCETAFFSNLPARARLYALPQPWLEKYQRFGGGGLSHAWVCQAAGRPKRLVSIHLSERPSVAAVLGGRAVETSTGFTFLDGLPSLTSCGEIDPAIVLDLLREGMSPPAVRDLLANQSGFQALSKCTSSLAEIITQDELSRQILLRQIVKAVGSALAALGGADVIAVACDSLQEWGAFIEILSARFSFLSGRGPSSPRFMPLAAPRETVLFDALARGN